jgi:predicted dehydrogenase
MFDLTAGTARATPLASRTLRRRFRRHASSPEPAAVSRVGVVGLGYWGPNLLRVISEHETCSLACICDRDLDRLDQMQRRYPAVQACDDLDALLDDDSVDAIVLATPVGTHAELAEASLRAGKHTFVEKPLAASAADARHLAALARQRNLVLMCGHTFTYSPPVRAVKDLIARGDLGDIFFISSSRVNLGLHQRDVSVLWDLGPHDFSILRYWLDETPATISASGRDAIVPGIPDVAFLSLQYDSGVLGNIELSWLAPSKLRRTVLVGSEKMVVYEDGAPEPVRVFDHGVVYEDPETFGEYHLSYRTGDIVSPRVEVSEPLALEIADFLAAAASGKALDTQLGLALDVVDMIEAAEASLLNGGAPVRVDGGVQSGLAA